MLLGRHTAWLVLGLILLLPGLAVRAQGRAGDAPRLGWADGEAAFGWVQGWVRSPGGVPEEVDLPGKRVAGLFGVYVTLRDDGRVLGRGQAIREDVAETIDQPGPAVELASLLAAATRQALDELRDKQMKRAVELGITDPELFKQALMEMRERVQVDVQLGHKLESVVLPLDAEDDAVFAGFAPGFHGLRLAGPIAAHADYAWPATELSRNTSPPRMIFRLLERQGYDAEDLPLVARGDGPRLQRFHVLHYVRPRADQPMRGLIRGNMIMQQQVVDGRTIAGLAERTARYLEQLITEDLRTGELVVRGTYQPSAQRYAPKWADDREIALLCYALTRHASIAIDQGVNPGAMRTRAKRTLRIATRLAPRALPEDQPPKHLTAAFILLTLCNTPEPLKPDQLVLRDRIGQALLDLKHPEGGGFRAAPNDDKRLTRASAAVVTAALTAWFDQTRSKTLAQPVWEVIDQLMRANEDDPRVIDLLWIGQALSKTGPYLAKVQDDPAAAAKALAKWHGMLGDYLELLSEQQVRGRPTFGPEDVIGGFIFNPAVPGSAPNPDWQSAMPVTLIALGLRDPAIVPSNRVFGPLLSAGLGARFLGQLMITEPSTYYLRDPKPALGGIRNTLWDNTLYPDCASVCLIALAELQYTLDLLEPKAE